MERYDNYKDCGIYYLPLLPSDWQILRAKYLFKQEQRPVKDSDEIITCFRDGQVTLRRNRRIDGFTNSLKEIGYQGVRRGDLVIHNMDAFAGAIGISDSDGKATPVYSCCTPLLESIDSYYYCFFLRYLAKSNFILSLAKGIRERSTDFRFSDFKKLYLPVPSYSEQQAIVAYLDEETGKLDAAVEKLERMVEVLKERKQLIISKAVTRGLDDSVSLKDSGVEWIGQIPEHWQKFRFKNLLQIKSKKSDSFFKVGLENIESQTGRFLSTSTLFDGDGIAFESGDILYGKLRPYLQKAWLANCSGSAVGDFFVYKVQPICVDRFMLYVLLSKHFTEVCTGATYGAKMPRVASEFISALPYFLPPIAEQQAIAAYLDEQVGKLDEAIEKQLRMIELLKERKQILISYVVTGKIKVA